MVTPSSSTASAWHSDAALAYAILRVTFGVNIGLRGLMRIVHGTDVFAADLMKQFAAAPLPLGAVSAFGHVLPWVETLVGLLLVLGLWSRPTLVAGGLMMTSLTFGTMLIENYQVAWLQLTYAGIFFLLLVLRPWNTISLDALRGGGQPARVEPSARVGG